MASVIVFSDCYLPGYKAGGPVASVSRIIDLAVDHQFRVITRDRDAGECVPYPDMSPRSELRVGNALVSYLRRGPRDILWLAGKVRRWSPHAYYLNSLHSPWFSLLPLLAMRTRILPVATTILAPRGECSAGALALKNKKKSVARPVIKRLIGRKVVWHLSSELEQRDLRTWWGCDLPSEHSVVIQSDPGVVPLAAPTPGPPKAMRHVVFASRIDRMKGLDEAIRIVSRIGSDVEFWVYGTVADDNYWLDCRRLAASLLRPEAFSYRGSYRPNAAQQIFANSSAFILPTHGENFGHAIAESLSVGCPVVVPDTTPWTHVVEAGGGHVIRSIESAAAYLSKLLEESPEDALRARSVAHGAYRTWSRGQAVGVDLFV
jgi:glycosyltransferase involved in cell wall biosynthesis